MVNRDVVNAISALEYNRAFYHQENQQSLFPCERELLTSILSRIKNLKLTSFFTYEICGANALEWKLSTGLPHNICMFLLQIGKDGGAVFQQIDALSKDFDNIVELELGTPWPLQPDDMTVTLAQKF
ncbi:hypothetical protein DKX38_015196 [Salix brachista]|uniref:Uncharacterized protein n=1 Tax=Salix brachista TaxID=2182728 RepID=A0A5N5L4I9_9ROSI|nr:hypothetical protein DKX38_015196 [Salix brachista]